MEIEAIIFDLDGTLIDNNAYHLEAWKKYLKNIGRELSQEEYIKNFNGRTNKDVVEYIHGRSMSAKQAEPYYLEKERLYREIYKQHICPVSGLINFLKDVQQSNIPMAIATSGIKINIDFMFENIPIRQFFKVVVNSTHIKKGKPDPEIYNVAAMRLNADPKKCIAFEDALVGIASAHGAGMKVVAITTSHTRSELIEADLIIDNYNDLTVHKLQSM